MDAQGRLHKLEKGLKVRAWAACLKCARALAGAVTVCRPEQSSLLQEFGELVHKQQEEANAAIQSLQSKVAALRQSQAYSRQPPTSNAAPSEQISTPGNDAAQNKTAQPQLTADKVRVDLQAIVQVGAGHRSLLCTILLPDTEMLLAQALPFHCFLSTAGRGAACR